MRKQNYQILDRKDSRKLAEYLSKDGQLLLPLLDLITNTEAAVDELIDLLAGLPSRLFLFFLPEKWPEKKSPVGRPAQLVGTVARKEW